MKKIFILLLFLILATFTASAETIKLKLGKTLEGKIIERTDKYIKVDIGIGMPITYFLDEVENIDGESVVVATNQIKIQSQAKEKENKQITLDELLSNMEKAVDSISDYSCKFTSVEGESPIFSEMFKMMEEMAGQPLPKEIEISIWVKKPFMMKTISSDGLASITGIMKKEGDDFYSYVPVLSKNQIYKQKLPPNSWPSWPSLESMLVVIKMAKDSSASYSIERKDNNGGLTYILTFESADAKRKDVYYIRESDWLIYKTAVYEDGRMVTTSEWQDVKINTGLSEDVFKPQIPEGTEIITQDLSQPNLNLQPVR